MLFTQEYIPMWSTTSRICFRFIFLFLIGFMIILPTQSIFSPILVWIGESIFETSGRLSVESTGSGDSTMSWLAVVLQLFIALLGTIIWTIIDHKRHSYNDLFYWFRIFLRIFLSFFMMVYGFAKVFLIQFSEPSLLKLLQPLGEMSPMGLAWTYMGFSPSFSIFTGMLEVIAGVILIPRRTQTLGAFMVVGVMTHVAVMNLCFDIPVKIFSIHLLLMGIVLLLSDSKRIGYAFLRKSNKEISKDYHPIALRYTRAIRTIKIISLTLVLMGVVGLRVLIFLNQSDDNKRDEFYGIWEVETFIKNGDTIAPLITTNERWRYLIMQSHDRATVKTMTDSIIDYHFKVDSTRTKVSIYKRNEIEIIDNFKLEKIDSLNFNMHGDLKGNHLDIKLKAKDLKKIRLINRGFHWINESPYNR